MANFQDILNKPSADIKPPEALPIGSYHCLVDGPPAAEESSQKKTPCRVYKFKIMQPMQDVDQAKATELQVQGKVITGQGSGAAFYITEDAVWRYKQFLEDHLGIKGDGKTLLQMEAEAPGRQVIVKLAHTLSQDGTRIFHRIDGFARV